MEKDTFTQDTAKTIEAVLYLCQQSVDDPNFGVPKLTKLLYYSDFAAWRSRNNPITGTTYLHFPHGPHPKDWHVIRQTMEAAGDIEVVHHDPGHYYHRYLIIPKRNPKPALLHPDETLIMDEQLQQFAQANANGIEETSREEASWRATEDGEPLDYRMAGYTAPPLSINSIHQGRHIAKQVAARKTS